MKMPPRNYNFLEPRLAQWNEQARREGLPAIWASNIAARKELTVRSSKFARDTNLRFVVKIENGYGCNDGQREVALSSASRGQCFGLMAKDDRGLLAIEDWWSKWHFIPSGLTAKLSDCAVLACNKEFGVLAFDTPEICNWAQSRMNLYARSHLQNYTVI